MWRRILVCVASCVILAACSGGDTAAPEAATDVPAATEAPATPPATAPTRSSQEVSIPVWVATLCAAGEEFEQVWDAWSHVVDPVPLELEARKARWESEGEAKAAAFLAFGEALAPINPPDAVRDYHESLLTQAWGSGAAFERGARMVAQATTAGEIDAVSQETAVAIRDLNNAAVLVGLDLPSDVVEALTATPDCGLIVIR